MKILYLCLQETREGQASYAHVHEIIYGLKLNGCEVDLIQPSYVNNKKAPGAIGKLYGVMIAQVKAIFAAKKYDIVYIRQHFFSGMTSIVLKTLSIPYVIENNGLHTDGVDLWPTIKLILPVIKALNKYELRNASCVVTVTPNLKKQIEKVTKRNDNVHLIPNGANTKLFSPDRKVEPIDMELPDKFVVFFGAFAKWQGIERIINCVISKNWPLDLYAIFIGDGVEKDVVIRGTEKCKNIIYIGRQPYKKIGSIVSRALAGLSLMSSNNERNYIGVSPLKLYEIMSSEIPVIVTDMPYMGEIVYEAKCGFVLPVEYSEDQLIDVLKSLMNNQNIGKTMGMNGRRLVINSCSWECRSKATFHMLNDIELKSSKGEKKHANKKEISVFK